MDEVVPRENCRISIFLAIFPGLQVRFVTNETQKTRKSLVEKLHRLGYSMVEEQVFPPALAMASLIRREQLKPFLLVHPNCLPDLDSAITSPSGPYNSVVLGDAVDGFSYENMNKAFRILTAGGGCKLYSLGKGKFYAEDGELTLDVGPFTAALEFATEQEAVVVGKPAAAFFNAALQDMEVSAEEAVMVGDDIVSDVGGAISCGIQGVLVRTGKYRASDETHKKVQPSIIVDRLEKFVDILLGGDL